MSNFKKIFIYFCIVLSIFDFIYKYLIKKIYIIEFYDTSRDVHYCYIGNIVIVALCRGQQPLDINHRVRLNIKAPKD